MTSNIHVAVFLLGLAKPAVAATGTAGGSFFHQTLII
jgi:hypothetical protein